MARPPSSAPSAKAPAPLGPGALLGGRFSVGATLAETDLSVVYAAVDEETGADVCVKRLRTSNGTTSGGQDEAAVRFRREAAILSRIAHPHVVRVLAAGAGHEGTWFAMELLDGETLDRMIGRGPLPVGQTLTLLRHVVDGLAYVHRHGVIHRDLKPHNIVVVDNEARIIDFGLAAEDSETASPSRLSAVVGTARYMAPEQAGLIWRAVGPRADLYAVGALAWEMLVGRAAFEDTDAGRLLRRIQCEAPPPLRSLAPHVPVALEKIVRALLEKNPDDRYQSAEALLHDLERLDREWSTARETSETAGSAERSAAGGATVDFALTRATSSVVDKLGAIFVGRASELAAAEELAVDVEAGRPRALLVHGRSGVGKSAYVAEIMSRLQARGAHVVTGKCAAVHAGVPYAALDDLLNAFLDVLERLPAHEKTRVVAGLREELGDSSGYVVRMSPSWGRVLEDGDMSSAGGARAEHERVLDAVSAIASALAPKDRMLAIFVDDLQWADASTVQLLRDLIESMRGKRVLLIGAWRSEETTLQSPVRALVSLPAEVTRTISVGPLSRDDVRALLVQLLGGDPPERLVEILHTRSEGNAFFAWELLRAWARADAFSPAAGRIDVDMVRLEATKLPTDLVGIVLDRLALLPPACLRVLGVASLVGRAFDLALVRACASVTADAPGALDDDAAYEALVAARDAQVLVQRPEGWSFAHDKVMEACGRFVDPMEYPILERKIGEWLETRIGDGGAGDAERLFEIALHYGASDDEERALQWAVRAADASSALLRHQEALSLYDNAERIRELKGEAATSPERLSLVEKKAAALDALGQYADAEVGWLRALEVPREPLDAARLYTKLALSQQKSGRYAEGHGNLLRALRLLGVRVRLDGVSQELFALVDRVRALGARRGPSVRLPTVREALVAEVLTRLWYFHCFYLSGKNHRKMYTLAYKLLAVTSSLGDCREKSIAHRLMAITLCQGDKPDFDGALDHSFRSVDIARRRDARMELAEAWLYVGIIHVWSARFSGAVEYLDKAAAMLEQIGNKWELANVHIFLFMAHKNLGRIDRALTHALEIVRVARRSHAAGSMVSGQSKLADVLLLQGDAVNGEDALRQSLALAAEKNLDFDLFMATKVEGAWLIRSGRYDDAKASFQRALDLNERNTFMRAYRADATVGWAEAVVRARLSAPARAEDARDDPEVKRALALLDDTVAAEERSRLHYVYALRVRALAHLLTGQRKKAESDAEQAMTVVTREGQPLEHPHVLELHAALLRDRDPERASGLLVEARRLFLQCGAAAEAARIGGLLREAGVAEEADVASALESARRQADALLQVSLASSSTLDPRVQARAALDELVRVFDADRAFLFLTRDDREDAELELDTARASGGTDAEGAEWSSTVVERVRVRREPIVVTGEAEGALIGSRSAVLYDLRSIMAAPLMVRDRLIGVVYLDNRLDRGVRSREDVQLLQAIANHIAVAFESARSARLEVERHGIEKEKLLLEKDLALTGIVQSMFLPHNGARTLSGVEVAGFHRPATSSGGDWWACDALAREGVRVIVGDVTGHGAAPAMLTAAMSSVVRSAARTRPELTTPELVGELHATLLDVCKGAYQMTLAALEVTVVDGRATLHWWNAGAPPLLVVTKEGRVVPHTATGSPVGSARFALEAVVVDLNPGDRVLVMTDGVLEQPVSTRGPSKDSVRPGGDRRPFGRKRVAQVLAASTGRGLDETLQAVVAALDEASAGEPQDDDVTLVMIGA